MEKFKRYLGLAMALGLLVLGFLPTGPNYSFPMASKLTPLDSTVLTQLTLLRDMKPYDGNMYFWMSATNYFNSCPPFQEVARRHPTNYSENCNGNGFLFATISRIHEAELTAIEPTFPFLLAKYKAVNDAERSEPKERAIESYGGNHVGNKEASARRHGLEFQIGKTMNKYLETQQSGLAATIYVMHGLLLMAVLFMVRGRRSVGGLVWFPFSLIFGAARVGAKADVAPEKRTP